MCVVTIRSELSSARARVWIKDSPDFLYADHDYMIHEITFYYLLSDGEWSVLCVELELAHGERGMSEVMFSLGDPGLPGWVRSLADVYVPRYESVGYSIDE